MSLTQPPHDCPLCPRLVAFREEAQRLHPDWHNNPVPYWGDEAAKLIIIGLAPGLKGANRTGRPFTGDYAGDLLYATLLKLGLATGSYEQRPDDSLRLRDTLIVNGVACVPPENKPTPAERDTCAPWLDRELALVLPHVRVVVALGAFGWAGALTALSRAGVDVPRPRPRFGHGAEVDLVSPHGPVVLLGCYHPSPHNTVTGRLTEPMTDEVLGRAVALARMPG